MLRENWATLHASEYLGVKLLTRSTHGLTPTEAGLGYLERANEEAAEAELAARGAGAGLVCGLRSQS